MTLLLVVVGGAAGAVLRYLTDRAIAARLNPVFPWGTLAVNVTASLLLGILTGAASALPTWVFALLGTGLAGALSTYSTFGYETLALLAGGARWYAVGNVLGTVAAGLGAGFAGVVIGLWCGAAAAG